MRRDWIHDQYRISPWGTTQAVAAPTRPAHRSSGTTLALIFMTGVAIGLVALLLPLRGGYTYTVMNSIDEAFSIFSGPRPFASSKEDFLAKLSSQERRRYSHQVDYVRDIIRSTNRRAKDAISLAHVIVRESIEANYDPIFVASVIKHESTFNKSAVSSVGAKGLMQILPGTGEYVSRRNRLRWLGAEKLHDPEYNVRLGIAYLKELERSFKGNRELALIAYNWGPGNVSKALKGEKNIPSSSRTYAKNIIKHHSKWHVGFTTLAANRDSGLRLVEKA